MDLNKLTKAELISKLEKTKSKSATELKSATESKSNKTQSSPSIIDVIISFKHWILSITIITILLKTFKQYKSIQAVLRLANYIIWTMFGMSILDAFGLTFLAKFFGELKYIFGAVITYLTESTFYTYLLSVFKVTDGKESIRESYKKTKWL